MFKKITTYHRKLLSAPVQAVPSIRDAKLTAARTLAGDFGTTDQWSTAARLFGEQLDDTYFNTHVAENIAQHVAQFALLQEGQEHRIIDEARQQYTYIVRNPEGKLISILDRLQKQGLSVKRSQSYVASDKSFAIYTFDCGEQARADLAVDAVRDKVLALYAAVKDTKIRVGGETRVVTSEDIGTFLASLSHPYLLAASSARLIRHFGLYARVALQDRDSVVEFEDSFVKRSTRITLVARNIPQTGFLAKAVRILDQHGLELQQVFVESMENDVTTRVRRELAAQIGEREPIRTLVQLVEDRGTSENVRGKAEEAIRSWGGPDAVATRIAALKNDNLEQKNRAREVLISMGTEAQEAARIITFYVVKKENRESLNDKRDAKLMADIREDLEAAKWFAGEEFVDSRLSQDVWRPRQLSLVWAAASFAHEMFGYRFRSEDRPTWEIVRNTFLRNADFTRLMVHFVENRFNPHLAGPAIDRNLLVAPLQIELNRIVGGLNSQDQQILGTALAFAQAARRTNYFGPTSSLAFELDPSIIHTLGMQREIFPEAPYGLFYVVGNGFRGFHNRFSDIARGGIRMKIATSDADFDKSTTSAYREGYRLAFTQDHKNPQGGLPEGGSKGIIVLKPGTNPNSAGMGFVDGLMDMFLGTETILFLGPDVDTAGYMEPWAQRARRRGHPYWRTFTSAKSEMGIRHDEFGMTTAGVIHFERLVLKKLGVEERGSTKVITGGPRGDLGGNEIKESVQAGVKILFVSDRSGVIYDPNGIDHTELMRLVDSHGRVADFRDDKLGSGGAIVRKGKGSQAVALPDGSTFTGDYQRFNDDLLFEIGADVLMPGDMREDVVNESNVHRLIEGFGTASARPRYKVLVEGANLFISQKARRVLEDHGVIVIKDASANPGGVMSSSREIQAAFLLEPAEFEEIKQTYAKQIQASIRASREKEWVLMEKVRTQAEAEYEAAGRAGPKPDLMYYSEVSIAIGHAIRTYKRHLLSAMEPDGLSNDPVIQAVVESHILPIVKERFGVERLSKIPRKYRNAIVAQVLAENIVYRDGLDCLVSVGQITGETILSEARRLTPPG